MKPIVSIVKADSIREAVEKSVEYIGGIKSVVRPGSTVMIKPNFVCALPPETGAISDPKIAAILAETALEAGAAKVILAEGIGARDIELADVPGIDEIARMKGVELVDLNDAPTEAVPVPDPLKVETFHVPKVVLKSDVIINLGKLKVHPQALFSLGMKNMMGALPGRSYRDPEEARRQGYLTPIIPGGGKKVFHDLARDQGIAAMHDAFVDLNTVIPSHLTVIDGLYAMEGKGAPAFGKPVKMDLLISGTDIVAVEAVAASVMGFDTDDIHYLKHAQTIGLGAEYRIAEIHIKGEKLPNVIRKFEPASADFLWADTCEMEQIRLRPVRIC